MERTEVSVVRFGLGLWALGFALACSGAAPAPAGPAGQPAAKDTRSLLAFRKAGECEWIRWSEATGPETVAKSPLCPEQVVFKPDGSKVVYTTPGEAHVASWPGLGSPVTVAYPTHKADWEPLWVGADGVLRLDGMVMQPTVTEEPDQTVLTSGEVRVAVKKTPSGGHEGHPPYGMLVIELSYEANRKGAGWTLLEARASKFDYEAPPLPRPHPDGWPALSSTYRACNDGQECEREDWAARADLTARFSERGKPGYLAPGWLFEVQWGDTAHAGPPAFSCADPECKTALALQDLPPSNQLALQPQGELLLVGQEFTMQHARVYRRGQAAPVYAVPDGEGAGWLPDGVR
jgi:hypothetical protein